MLMKFLRFLLFPFSIIYNIITSIRNVMFNYGILKSTSFKIPTIVVGNLSVGGTGKSPQIEYLIKLLKNEFKIAVLSRGYGRKTKGVLKSHVFSTADEVGDEPLQFFRKHGDITVAVDENRVHGISTLLESENPPEIVLLDDAFQHRKVQAGFSILLTKYKDLFVDDYVLPRGNLRESKRGAKRADVVIVTKCPENLKEKEQARIRKKLNKRVKAPVFFTSINYVDTIKSNSIYKITTDDLRLNNVLLVTGIANPTPLLDFLKEANCEFQHLKFPDHHSFTEKDLQKIQYKFANVHADKKIILTTEKDFVRLSDKIDRLYYIGIETSFITGKNDFDSLVKKHINSAL